jgi:branched-chain amino acid transport system permease protein
VLNGLLVGAYYLLIALGLSLIFSLGGIVNLAHGGSTRSAPIWRSCSRRASAFAGAFVASPLLVGLIGVVVERLFFRRFYRSDPILSLLLTFGLPWSSSRACAWAFGAAPLPFSIPPELRGQVLLGDFIYPRYRLIIFGIALAAVTATWFWSIAPPSAAWCEPACRTPTWSARSAFRCSPT